MIRVRLFAALRELAGAGELQVAGRSVGEVVEATVAAISPEHAARFAQIAAVSSFVVNGERATSGLPVADGDEVAILPPVSGGATRLPRTALLLGSGEFEPWVGDAERTALARATGDGSVVVLPTASASEGEVVFDRWAQMGLEHYAGLGIPARLVPLRRRGDAAREEFVSSVRAASMIFFSGGRPGFLAATLRDTPVCSAILEALDRGAVFGGCSAGAMIASAGRSSAPRRFDPWKSGLGILPEIVVGVHWDGMPKFLFPLRDLVAKTAPRGAAFLGVDERTAVLGAGGEWEVFGAGSVHVRHDRKRRSFAGGERFSLPSPG